MKILALNGSPQKEKSNTSMILNPFLEGASLAGAEVELFYITDRKMSQRNDVLEIRSCRGCYTCWFATPGRCPQNDGMKILLPKLAEADVWVIASPLYIGGVTGPLKTCLDRVFPLVEPLIEIRDSRSRHPLRNGVKHGSIILISNCGLWEMKNFDAMLAHFEEICEHTGRNFAGALLRPHGPILREISKSKFLSADDVFTAAKEAGRQLVLSGTISGKTAKTAGRNFFLRFLYNWITNRRSQKILAEIKK